MPALEPLNKLASPIFYDIADLAFLQLLEIFHVNLCFASFKKEFLLLLLLVAWSILHILGRTLAPASTKLARGRPCRCGGYGKSTDLH